MGRILHRGPLFGRRLCIVYDRYGGIALSTGTGQADPRRPQSFIRRGIYWAADRRVAPNVVRVALINWLSNPAADWGAWEPTFAELEDATSEGQVVGRILGMGPDARADRGGVGRVHMQEFPGYVLGQVAPPSLINQGHQMCQCRPGFLTHKGRPQQTEGRPWQIYWRRWRI